MAIMFFVMQGWTQTTLNESFEGTTFPPDDWTIATTAGSGSWQSSTSIARTGTKSANSAYASSGCTRWLISPRLSVTSDATNFAFWIATDDWYIDGDNIDILVSTTNNETSSFSTTSLLSLNQDSVTTTWKQYSVDLQAYVGQDIYVAIRVIDNNGFNTFIDDVTGPNLFVPSCPKPTLLTTSNITTTGANLGWTDATGSVWNVQYMLDTTNNWANATNISGVTSNPYTIQGLNPSSLYKARVQTDCTSEQSEWSTPVSFRTACGTITTLPWSESFDTYGTGEGTYPVCWTKINTYSSDYPRISTTNHSSPGSLRFYRFFNTYNIAVTPAFDASIPINTLTARFYLKNLTSSSGGLVVGVMTTPNDATTFDSITTIAGAFTWAEYEVNFSSYSGTGQYIAFKNPASSITEGAFYIDDLVVNTIPQCIRPSAVAITNGVGTSVNVTFTPGNTTDNSWYVFYKSTTATTWDSIQTNSIPATLSNLTPQTTYQIYVKTDCGNNSFSNASTTITYTTPCDMEINTLPWSENFDNYGTGEGTFPTCWRKINTYSSDRPYIKSTNHSAPGSLYFYTSTSGTYNIAVTPPFDINIPINTLMAKFYYRNTNTTDKLVIGIMTDPTNAATFDSITTIIAPTTETWAEDEVNFSSYTGAGRYIAFKNEYTTDNAYAYIDDLIVDYIPTCLRPTAVTTINGVGTSVDVTFTPGNTTDNSWYVFYKPNTATDWDSIQTNSNPTTLSNLTLGTIYQIYVKTDCGDGTNSNASTIITYTTPCSTITTLPWSENFDTYGTDAGTFPTCWTKINTDPLFNQFYITNSTNHSSPGSLYFYGLFGAYNVAATPAFDASIPINTLIARFYFKKMLTTDKLIVGVMTDPTNRLTFDSITTISGTSTWAEYEVNFNSYTGQGHYIAFKNSSTLSMGYAYIDDLVVNTIPTCARPTNIATTNGVSTSVDVTFTPGNTTDNSWYVYYKPTTSTNWDSIQTNSIPATLSNLTLQTTYDIYVKTDCGNGEMSNASNTITYSTPCDATAISSFPWAEGFENGFNCWQQLYVNGTLNWTNPNTYLDSMPHEGNKIALFAGEASTNITKLVSPLLDITYLSNPYLSYWYILQRWDADRDTLRVYSRSSENSSWTLLRTFYALDTYAWKKDSIALPNPSSTYQIAFEGIESYGHGVGLDEITIYDNQTVACPDPTSVAISNITTTTADVTWTAGGTETAWQVRLGLNGTPIDVTTTSYQLTNLLIGSNDTVYVRANCGGTYSSWVSQTFTTTPIYQAPTVTTVQEIGTTQTSTNLNGSYVQGTNPILVKGFQWKQSNTSTWTIVPVTAGTTPFVYALNSLTENTQYDFRAYVETSQDTTYGLTLQFTTLANVLPTVTTTTVTNITKTTATFNGTTAQGTESIQARGFEYKPTSTSTWTGAIDVTATGTATITANVTGLTANTQYDVRAYAQTQTDNKTYGNIETFKTDSLSGLNDIDANKFSVSIYPNPATNTTKLVVSGVEGETDIIINDAQGKLIYKTTAKAVNGKVEQTIDVNNFAKGVYYVRIQNQTTSRTQKLIVIN